MYWPSQSPGLNLIEYSGCAGGDFTEWIDYPIVNAALDGNTFSDVSCCCRNNATMDAQYNHSLMRSNEILDCAMFFCGVFLDRHYKFYKVYAKYFQWV